MRYIFLLMMLTGMLFSAQQKQIIVGSFSIESNALFYSIDVQKTVDNNPELKKLLEKYGVKVEYRKIGKYNVVSIYPFNDYPSLFVSIAELHKYYPDAYAIRYPAFDSMLKTPVEKNDEPIIEDEDEDVQETAQVEKVNDLPQEVKTQELKTIVPKSVEPKEPEIKYEAPSPVIQKDESLDTNDLILLIILLLVVIGFVAYKIKTKNKVIEV